MKIVIMRVSYRNPRESIIDDVKVYIVSNGKGAPRDPDLNLVIQRGFNEPHLVLLSLQFMSPKSLFFQFLIRISFRSRRKPRPPSPTTSLTLVDSSVQYKAHSLSEKECTIAVDFDPDLWRNILSYCEVVDIIRIGMVYLSDCVTVAPY